MHTVSYQTQELISATFYQKYLYIYIAAYFEKIVLNIFYYFVEKPLIDITHSI